MRRLKIFFLSDNFYPERNAAATRVFERGVYWAEAGHELTVLTSVPNFPEGRVYSGYKNSWYKREIIQGIKVKRVKTFIAANKGFAIRILDFLSYMMSSFFAGLLLIKNHDVIIATSPQFFTAVSAWALSKIKRKPFIFELSDLWPESIRAVGVMKSSWILDYIEKFELFLYHQSAAVIALTDEFKVNLVRRGIDGKKIFVVKNGVDLRRHRPASKDAQLAGQLGLQGKFVISYIGTIGAAHELVRVVHAAKELKRRDNRNVVFLFVGTGVDLPLLKVEAGGLDNVVFVEPQSKERIGLYWNLSDVCLVHLKNSDTFKTVIPSKMFEAMGYGKPILMVSPEGEASSILLSAKAGWHTSSYQLKDFVNMVEEIQKNTVELQRLSENSLQSSKEFTRQKQADDFLSVISTVVDSLKKTN